VLCRLSCTPQSEINLSHLSSSCPCPSLSLSPLDQNLCKGSTLIVLSRWIQALTNSGQTNLLSSPLPLSFVHLHPDLTGPPTRVDLDLTDTEFVILHWISYRVYIPVSIILAYFTIFPYVTASISQCSYQKHVKKYFLNRYSFFSTVQGNKWWKKKYIGTVYTTCKHWLDTFQMFLQ